jgi:hypothetical protein
VKFTALALAGRKSALLLLLPPPPPFSHGASSVQYQHSVAMTTASEGCRASERARYYPGMGTLPNET